MLWTTSNKLSADEMLTLMVEYEIFSLQKALYTESLS